MKVSEAFIAERQKYKCLWDMKAWAYKNCSTRENTLRTSAKLFEIVIASFSLGGIDFFKKWLPHDQLGANVKGQPY